VPGETELGPLLGVDRGDGLLRELALAASTANSLSPMISGLCWSGDPSALRDSMTTRSWSPSFASGVDRLVGALRVSAMILFSCSQAHAWVRAL
jgi:hypothetical protein